MQLLKKKNGMEHFHIRTNDKCSWQTCEGNKLTAYGIAEEGEKKYKVVTRCDKCGTFYSFFRINKREI